jgi:hypothetical protein
MWIENYHRDPYDLVGLITCGFCDRYGQQKPIVRFKTGIQAVRISFARQRGGWGSPQAIYLSGVEWTADFRFGQVIRVQFP